jgi:hypothetical protein
MAISMLGLMAVASFCGLYVSASRTRNSIAVSDTPINASAPIPEAFVSFSIEFAYFPDYAGTKLSRSLFSHLQLTQSRKLFVAKFILQQSAEQSRKSNWDQTLY